MYLQNLKEYLEQEKPILPEGTNLYRIDMGRTEKLLLRKVIPGLIGVYDPESPYPSMDRYYPSNELWVMVSDNSEFKEEHAKCLSLLIDVLEKGNSSPDFMNEIKAQIERSENLIKKSVTK